MSTLRETLHRLVDSVTAWGARERVAIPADVTVALCDAARALESETREARTPVDAAGVARLLDAIDTAEVLKTKTNAEIGKLMLDHVWQHMDLNSAAELVMSEAISRLAPDLEGEAPPPANKENDR